MLKKLTIIAVIAAGVISGQVYAKGDSSNDSSAIENLPKSGSVTITGIVDRVSGDNKFMLRDSSGKTIDVNTNEEIDVDKGDKVTVTGDLSSEVAGMGKEINNATVADTDLEDNDDDMDDSDDEDEDDY